MFVILNAFGVGIQNPGELIAIAKTSALGMAIILEFQGYGGISLALAMGSLIIRHGKRLRPLFLYCEGHEVAIPQLCAAMKWSREMDVERGYPLLTFPQFRAAHSIYYEGAGVWAPTVNIVRNSVMRPRRKRFHEQGCGFSWVALRNSGLHCQNRAEYGPRTR